MGVVSKTDLILAYKHGMPDRNQARTIMNFPVQACDSREPLVAALKTMISYSDVHRLFVYQDSPQNLVGILSLSDVARASAPAPAGPAW